MRLVNRRAKHDYHILKEIEVGVVLTGAEVKSLRAGRGTLSEAFAKITNGEVWIYNFNIPSYQHADHRGYDPSRSRKLLLHKKQILSLEHMISGKRLTLIPLVCYTTGRYVKVRLGLGRGKKAFEKREKKKRKDIEREMERTLKHSSH